MDRGRRRRAAVAGAARVLAGRNGSRSTSSSRSCSPLSPPFSFSSSSAAASRQPREDAREREVSPSACQPVRLRAARRGSHRGGGGGSGSIAPPAPPRLSPQPRRPPGWGWLRARGSRSGRGLRSGAAAAGTAGGPCGAGAGAAARSAAAAAAAAGAGAAAARGPCSLLARSAPGTVCFSCEGGGLRRAARGGRSQSRAPEWAGAEGGGGGAPPAGHPALLLRPEGSRAAARLGPGRSARGCVHPSIRRPRPPPAVAPCLPSSAAAPGRCAVLGPGLLRPGPPGPAGPGLADGTEASSPAALNT